MTQAVTSRASNVALFYFCYKGRSRTLDTASGIEQLFTANMVQVHDLRRQLDTAVGTRLVLGLAENSTLLFAAAR